VGGHDNEERSTEERKKDDERNKKSGSGFVAVCCAYLPQQLVRAQKKMETKSKNLWTRKDARSPEKDKQYWVRLI